MQNGERVGGAWSTRLSWISVIFLHKIIMSCINYRTNPKANVNLSGKKKRLLLKEAKRLATEKKQMEGDG